MRLPRPIQRQNVPTRRRVPVQASRHIQACGARIVQSGSDIFFRPDEEAEEAAISYPGSRRRRMRPSTPPPPLVNSDIEDDDDRDTVFSSSSDDEPYPFFPTKPRPESSSHARHEPKPSVEAVFANAKAAHHNARKAFQDKVPHHVKSRGVVAQFSAQTKTALSQNGYEENVI